MSAIIQANRFNQQSVFRLAGKSAENHLISAVNNNDEVESEGKDPHLPLYEAPNCLKGPLDVPSRILVCGGPSSPYERSREGLRKNPMGMFDPLTIKMMDDIREGLRYAFQTTNEWTFPLTGTGHVAIETLLANLLEPEDTILIPILGSWGHLFSEMARRTGATVRNIEKPFGCSFSIEEIEAGLITHRPQVLYMIQGESSTGVEQRIEGIGKLCRKYNCLLLVDLVATVGIIPFFFDKWEVDAAYCNNHKGFGAPIGMAPISLGPRALEKIKARKSKPKCYLYDIQVLMEKNYWCIDKSRADEYQFHHSLPISLMYGLRESLSIFVSEGLESSWRRHAEGSRRLAAGMEGCGLEHYVKNPLDRLVGTITYKIPKDMTPSVVIEAMRNSDGVEIGTGVGMTRGTLLRFGLFGPNADEEKVEKVISAFRAAYKQETNL